MEEVKKKKVILAGNPNVGKSSLFNALTGMNQHTGNWPGKTVSVARGMCKFNDVEIEFIDVPGTYSLMSHSDEEEVARNCICFEKADATVVVCDATALERNLNLALQINEICNNTIICINLMDEAKRKNITINTEKLSKILGLRVVTTIAKDKKTIKKLIDEIVNSLNDEKKENILVRYDERIEKSIEEIKNLIDKKYNFSLNTRWVSIKLLENDFELINTIDEFSGINLSDDKEIQNIVRAEHKRLSDEKIDCKKIRDMIITAIITRCEKIALSCVKYYNKKYDDTDRKLDKFFTGKKSAYPSMIILMIIIFWITINGANYPSEALSYIFNKVEVIIYNFFCMINLPIFISDSLVFGVYRVLSWIVSVMLPPMAIFFPLFTYLEDSGFLPRIAYNLDGTFKKCSACGKQSLTMCMGFGCNAVGVMGARIIDSKREKLLAILTNAFVPCNGRFPTIIMIISMFFVYSTSGIINSVLSSAILTLVILFSIFMTFVVTKILSSTVLKGYPSAFTLELPPYRKPKITEIIVRSVFDRTLFVLKRSVKVAAPSGLLIWIMANCKIGNVTLLSYFADILEPFGKIMGLDGILLMAFILGFPANEIVIPIAIMGYMSLGSVEETQNLIVLKEILVSNGWTIQTAISVIIFSLMHWPCLTTLLTIRKETNSIKWTVFSIIIPTITGIMLCILFTQISNFFV